MSRCLDSAETFCEQMIPRNYGGNHDHVCHHHNMAQYLHQCVCGFIWTCEMQDVFNATRIATTVSDSWTWDGMQWVQATLEPG
jgi:hypothetical protein